MEHITPFPVCPHVAVINGRLYGYGKTREQAQMAFEGQIAGGGTFKRSMRERVRFMVITDEEASEVVEMLSADAIRWS